MGEDHLQAYFDAWDQHDIDTIMQYMTEDCVFETGGGVRFQGYEAVRTRIMEVWQDIPDIRFENLRHIVQDDSACSEWSMLGHRRDGSPVDVQGCDIFTFRDGKIYLKNSYIKNSAASDRVLQ